MATKLLPFEKINTPGDDYHGPAAGLGSEHGDSWRAAMEKVNAGFAHVYGLIEAGGSQDMGALLEEIVDLRETVAAQQLRLDAITNPGTPPIEGVAAHSEGAFRAPGASDDMPGDPATGGTPQPIATKPQAPNNSGLSFEGTFRAPGASDA